MNAGEERNGTSKFSGSITLRMDKWACSHRMLKGFHIDCGSAVEIVFGPIPGVPLEMISFEQPINHTKDCIPKLLTTFGSLESFIVLLVIF